MQPNIESGLGWMAWTWQTAVFFGVIAVLLVLMGLWEWRSPGGSPRRGMLGLTTTRGDRLFMSLLAAGYIHLLWLATFGAPLWGASTIAIAVAWVVFRYA
jgi:predicted small integral membrane protein